MVNVPYKISIPVHMVRNIEDDTARSRHLLSTICKRCENAVETLWTVDEEGVIPVKCMETILDVENFLSEMSYIFAYMSESMERSEEFIRSYRINAEKGIYP